MSSFWSIGSHNSILSIYSSESVLSIGSMNSVLSIGSFASFGSLASVGSALSSSSLASVMSFGSVMSAASNLSLLSYKATRRYVNQPEDGPGDRALNIIPLVIAPGTLALVYGGLVIRQALPANPLRVLTTVAGDSVRLGRALRMLGN